MNLKLEPVRIYSVLAAAAALAAYFLPSDAWFLTLALVAAVLGVGNVARSKVTPLAKVEEEQRRLWP